ILSGLCINAVPLHGPSTSITPQIAVDWLTLDDNDANLSNGTPHYWEILGGFAYHGMCPPSISCIVWVDFTYNGAENGMFDHPFKTWAEGVRAVPRGGTVFIKPGSSTEHPLIDKAMVLQASAGLVRIGG